MMIRQRISKRSITTLFTANVKQPSLLLQKGDNKVSFTPVTEGAIQVKISNHDHFTAIPNSCIAMSSNTKKESSSLGGYHNVVSRALVGAQPLFDQFSSLYADLPTNLIIKPQVHRHSTLISLSGNTDYYIKKNSLLAFTSSIILSTVSSANLGIGNAGGSLFVYKCSGKGEVAFSSSGSAFRYSLAVNEIYHVDARFLVAWDTSLTPKPAFEPTPADVEKLVEIPVVRKDMTIQDKILAKSKSLGAYLLSAVARLSVRGWEKFRVWSFGQENMYTITGPGDFFMTGEIDPAFSARLRRKTIDQLKKL